MENNLYIAHYGILGQKWGKRNGPPYPLSSSQMSSSERKAVKGPSTKKEKSSSSESGWFKATVKGGKDKPNMSPAEAVAKEAQKSVENLEGISRTLSQRKRKNTTSEKARSMTDKELRDAINRIELERRYDSLTSDDINEGWEATKDVLGIVGGTLAIAASVLKVISIVKGVDHV